MTHNPVKTVYTIPSTQPFAARLAEGVLELYGGSPEKLPLVQIFLPSRRACRTVREAFLNAGDHQPLLLPRLQPLGDMDADELSLSFETGEENFDLPGAMPPLRRQALLTALIAKIPGHDGPSAQRLKLAAALGRLMDQIYTENLDLARLPDLVDRDIFAKHWQITVDFLSVLSEEWPKILSAHGLIDAADRRNRLIKARAQLWQNNPPDYPVIAAGSTGSIPAVRELLNVIAGLPGGCVILPGLDQEMKEESWEEIEETHPQATLKALLSTLNTQRKNVTPWPACKDQDTDLHIARRKLGSEVMRPSATTPDWITFGQSKETRAQMAGGLENLMLYECPDARTEAQVIALALRETLETPGRTAALITPDRDLARRVAGTCKRWGIEIDDSAGQSLDQTSVGTFLLRAGQAAFSNLEPTALLAALKHKLCAPADMQAWTGNVRRLDLALRGPAPRGGFDALQKHIADKDFSALLEEAFTPLLQLIDGTYAFDILLRTHLGCIEKLCLPERLWADEDGETASLLLQDLLREAPALGDISAQDYLECLQHFLSALSVRPRYGTHPRLQILGQIEARLLHTDRVILAGLNEGSWPQMPAADPWMSKPMRARFGLPPPERGIGLSAHDFIQGLSHEDVILTRSLRSAGTLTVPARWIERLDAVLDATGHDPKMLRTKGPHLRWAQEMDKAVDIKPAARPAPCPPVEARPKTLSVTRVEKWLQDPYAIYAEKILGLSKLDPVAQQADFALKGTLLHDMLHEIMLRYKDGINDDKKFTQDFIQCAEDKLDAMGADTALLSFWKPRLRSLAHWLAGHEMQRQESHAVKTLEARGTCSIKGPVNFTLSARADRIDESLTDKTARIIDYKSAGSYTKSAMMDGRAPQLALEGLIAQSGGFENISAQVDGLAYLVLSGDNPAGQIISLSEQDTQKAIEAAQDSLKELLQSFYGEAPAPYSCLPDPARAPRYNDHAHLARVREWSALQESAEEAA